MKVVYLIAVLISVSGTARSQFKLNKPGLLPQLKSGINKHYLLPPDQPTAKFLEGSVYILPQDNMPCLVPSIPGSNRMPVYKPFVENLYIPNPYSRQDLASLYKNSLQERKYSNELLNKTK